MMLTTIKPKKKHNNTEDQTWSQKGSEEKDGLCEKEEGEGGGRLCGYECMRLA
jgi:hypothetical protein